jgi:hypothetical protein
MIALFASTAIEGALILALSWGAVYTLRMSGVYSDVVTGMNYFYPLTATQVYVLLIVLVSLLGIFMIFALGTKGIKWFIFPILALCIPTLVARSGLPTYLEEEYGIPLDFAIFNSDLTLTGMLVMALALVAGFVVLHQMISLREMGDHLSWRGVDEADITNAYKGRSVAIIVIVLISVVASYFVSHYSSTMKGIFSERLSLSPLMYLVVGVGGGLVAIVIIIMLLVTQKPKAQVALETEPKRFRQKAATEAGAVLHMFVPSSIVGVVGRAIGFVLRPVAMVGRLGARCVKSSGKFSFLKRRRAEYEYEDEDD